MEPHEIELPRKILVGKGILDNIPSVCESFDIRDKILVISDETTRKIAGDIIKDSLSSDIAIIKDSHYSEVERLKSEHTDINLVIAAGGGKVIDVGKLLAFEKEIPFISVPTAPSHDGITSERVSISDENGKHSVRAKPPIAIIADIDIMMKAPYKLIASGCADIISNHTAVYDWKLAEKNGEYYSRYAATLSLLSAEIVLRSADNIKNLEERGIRDLVEALVTSGIAMSLAHTSRPASGSEHLFSHALDQLGSGKLHGEQCGLGAILMARYQGQDWRAIKSSLERIGAPTTAKEIGLDQDIIVDALVKARGVRKRYTILDKKPLDRQSAIELCKETGVFG